MRNKRLIALAAVASMLLAGCSAASEPAPAAVSEVVTGPQQPRDELRILAATRSKSLDPVVGSSISEVQILKLAGATLFNLDDDGRGVTPGLAESGEFSDDATAYRVKLQEGLAFSDGSPLTAADVVATLMRGVNFEGNLYAGEFAPISTATAVDDQTIDFTFSRAYPSFEMMLSFPEFTILKADEISADGTLPASPTFAGPYALESDFTGNEYSLVRNEHFSGKEPSVERLNFAVVTDPAGRLAQVQGNEADLAVNIGTQALSRAVAPAQVHVTPAHIITQLTMNNESAPLDDARVRQAISLALDRATISDLAWGGQAAPNAGLLPTSSQGAAPGDPAANPEKAKELLKGTACEHGCELSILHDASTEWQSTSAAVVQQNLKAIGIEANIEPTETGKMYESLESGQYDLYLGYFGAYADLPDTTASYCMSYSYGFLSCYSRYQSAEAETAVIDATLAKTPDELDAAYESVNKIFANDAPLATLTDFAYVWASNEQTAGYAWISSNSFLSIAPAK